MACATVYCNLHAFNKRVPEPPHAEGALSEVPGLLLAENGVETDNLPPRLSLSLRKSLSLVSRNSALSERHYPLP